MQADPCRRRNRKAGRTETYLDKFQGNGRADLVPMLHESFEVHLEKLEDEIEFLVGMHDLQQPERDHIK